MRRVAVTGLGAVTPIGNNVADMWRSVKEGVCGIAPITHYDTTGRKVTLAAEVKEFQPEEMIDKKELRRMDRFTQFAAVAAKEAIEDAGLVMEQEDPKRCGVVVSSGIGGIDLIQEFTITGEKKGYDRISPLFIPMSISNIAAGQLAITYGFRGMCSCPVTACAGGTNAIGDAFHYIRDGYAEVMLCGGTEACITPLGMGGFTVMKALSAGTDPDRASIPFDAERSGFVMGEGAGILVLEEYEHAVRRGARIYCELVGYGATCDANHITAPLEDGSGAADCMTLALEDAKLRPEDITYINAHGTSTPLNDRCETNAIKTAFGSHAGEVMVSSTKAMTGHMLGAAGAVEGIISALSVCSDYVPATINYRTPDEQCDLDIVPNTGRDTVVDCAMSNSLGFGGHNASIIFKKCENGR